MQKRRHYLGSRAFEAHSAISFYSACTSPCHREAQKNTQAQQILTVLIARASKGRRYSPFQGARPPPGAMQSSLAGWMKIIPGLDPSRTTRHEKSQVSSRQESGFVNI
jgi:hypothetical protein